jgi:hypothetical protein
MAFSRRGQARKILGLVTDALELSAADVIRTYETHWIICVYLSRHLQPVVTVFSPSNGLAFPAP